MTEVNSAMLKGVAEDGEMAMEEMATTSKTNTEEKTVTEIRRRRREGGLQYRSIYIGYIQDDIGVDVDIDIGKIRPQCAEEKGVLSHLYINEL